ncbi:MAG: hypothetical protein SVZ03_16930 [Spirochaetota bacterium]|nr:hypothetical protein [Spirochaetota bacterium]
MKKLLIKLLFISLLITITCIGIWILPGNYISDLAILINKINMLQSKDTPRIVFIGGSNLLSLDSPLIERELKYLNYSVANMGLFGALGIKHLLNNIKPYLRPHDVLIIISEYGVLLRKEEETEEDKKLRKYYFLISPKKNISRYFINNQYYTLPRDIFELLGLKIKTYLRNTIELNYTQIFENGRRNYKKNYNEYGDRINPYQIIQPLLSSGVIYTFSDASIMNNILFINNICDSLLENNVKVLLFLPPFPYEEYNLNKKIINNLYDNLIKYLTIPVIGTTNDSLFPREYFADSIYHLNVKGESQRTRKLIAKLKEVL